MSLFGYVRMKAHIYDSVLEIPGLVFPLWLPAVLYQHA